MTSPQTRARGPVARHPVRPLAAALARPEPWAFLLTALLLLPGVSRYPAWGDALEFTAAAPALGVVHPTGYPLYSLVAKAATSVPISSIPRRLNGASLVAMALAAALLCGCLGRLVARGGAMPRLPATEAWACLALACWAVAGPTARAAGTTAEVYALHLALQAFLVRAAFEIAGPAGRAGRAPLRWLLAGAFVAGLAMTHHRMALFAVAMCAFSAAVFVGRSWRRGGRGRLLASAGALFLLGLTPILCLPIRAAANPPVNWGAPDSAGRLAWVLGGGEFVTYRFLHLAPGQPLDWRNAEELSRYVASRTDFILDWLRAELLPASFHGGAWPALALALVAAAAVAGFATLWRRQSLRLLVLVGVSGGLLFLTFAYNIADPEGYLLACWATVALLVGVGVCHAVGALESALAHRPVAWVGVALLALPLGATWLHVTDARLALLDALGDRGLPATMYALRTSYPEAHAYRLLERLPPNAVLVTSGDNDAFGVWYAQCAYGVRRDVLPIGGNFLKEAWYARMLEAHPARLDGVTTGGGTPTDARAFVGRLMASAIRPAWAAGRPVFLSTDDTLVLDGLRAFAEVAPAFRVLGEEEAAFARAITPFAQVPDTIFRLMPPGGTSGMSPAVR